MGRKEWQEVRSMGSAVPVSWRLQCRCDQNWLEGSSRAEWTEGASKTSDRKPRQVAVLWS